MASPVGHALAGIVTCQCAQILDGKKKTAFTRKSFILGVLLANLPDLDFLLGYLLYGDFHAMHGGVTHTLPFALIMALAFAGFRWFGSPIRTFVVCFFLISSHLLVDYCSGETLGFSEGYGIMWLYPFSEHRSSAAIKIFMGVTHEDLDRLFSLGNLLGMVWELAFFLPLIVSLEAWKRIGSRDSSEREVGKIKA